MDPVGLAWIYVMAKHAESPRRPDLDELLAHAGGLRRLARRLVTDGAQADDLVQETWVAALERPRRPGVPLGPWLAVVLRNRARQLGRAGARRKNRERIAARSEAQLSVDELSARAELSRDLVAHVLELPEPQREVLLLRHFEDLSTARMAELLGLSEGAVRSRLARGHAALRERLDREAGGDRAAWVSALAPLGQFTTQSPGAPAGVHLIGGILMSTATKVALGAALLLCAGLAAFYGSGDEPGMEPARVVFDPEDPVLAQAEGRPRNAATLEERVRRVPAALPLDGARVTALVVDRESGHPVPFLELGIAPRASDPARDAPEESERLRTDAEGRFTTERRYSLGGLQATILEEHDWHSVRRTRRERPTGLPPVLLFDHRSFDEEAKIEADLGPAFYVRATWPAGTRAEDFTPHITRGPQPGQSLKSGVLVEAGLTLVRFTRSDLPLEREGELRLLLGSEAWCGRAAIEWRKSWPLPEVAMSIASSASVSFLVADEDGHGPPSVELGLVPGHVPDDQIQSQRPTWAVTSGTPLGGSVAGSYPPRRVQARWVPTGAHTLRARTDGFEPATRWLDLVQGSQEVEVRIGRDPEATGRISGILRTASGEPPTDPWRVWLRRTDVPRSQRPRGAAVESVDGSSPWLGRFEIEFLAEGEYEVWVRCSRGDTDAPAVAPKRQTALASMAAGGELEFVLQDRATTQRLELSVVDAVSGEPLDDAQALLLWAPMRGDEDPIESKNGKITLERRESIAGCSVWVVSEGRASAIVPLPAGPDSDGVHRLRVALSPGWGALAAAMELVDGAPRPIAGATFLLDGRAACSTGQGGYAGITQAARPEHVAVDAPGYMVERIRGPVEEDGRLKAVAGGPFQEAFIVLVRRK